MLTSKASLDIHGLDIEVMVNGNRAGFMPTTPTPQNLGHIQTATKDWLDSLGYPGSTSISGEAVVAEVTGHTFTPADIEKAETYLSQAFSTSKGMAG